MAEAVLAHRPLVATARGVPRFRACDLCEHGVTRAGQRLCARRTGWPAAAPESLDSARSPLGTCGPEARFLDVPAWHL